MLTNPFSVRSMLSVALAAALLTLGSLADVSAKDEPADQAQAKKPAEKPLIQIAILLDTSGSMRGLIDQAKTHLWQIVNEFATAKQDGQRPEFQVALYEYGNNGLAKEGGYIRQIVPLTVDLDKVSEELFRLSTNGGKEYCGQVIEHAIKNLKWSRSPKDYKAIFIAGNEPFTQGPVDYKKACKEAIEYGVIVNTIHCGDYNVGVQGKWKDGADRADGSYTHIDHNRQVVQITAPQDKEILELNKQLNSTYVGFGAKGRAGKARQEAQDAASAKLAAPVAAQRAASKASGLYNNATWDLVDAVNQGKVKLEDLADDKLPENMRKMSLKERKAYVAEQTAKRKAIRDQIQSLTSARDKYVAAERKKKAEEAGDKDNLGERIIENVRRQAQEKSFEFKKE